MSWPARQGQPPARTWRKLRWSSRRCLKTLRVSGITRQFSLAVVGACLIYGSGPGRNVAGSAVGIASLVLMAGEAAAPSAREIIPMPMDASEIERLIKARIPDADV